MANNLGLTVKPVTETPAEEIERVRTRALSGFEASRAQPGVLASRAFTKAVYGDHAYGKLEDETTLAAIDRAERSVTLCTYIFDPGEAGDALAAALAGAHQRGAKVRVLIDAVGARYRWPAAHRTTYRSSSSGPDRAFHDSGLQSGPKVLHKAPDGRGTIRRGRGRRRFRRDLCRPPAVA